MNKKGFLLIVIAVFFLSFAITRYTDSPVHTATKELIESKLIKNYLLKSPPPMNSPFTIVKEAKEKTEKLQGEFTTEVATSSGQTLFRTLFEEKITLTPTEDLQLFNQIQRRFSIQLPEESEIERKLAQKEMANQLGLLKYMQRHYHPNHLSEKITPANLIQFYSSIIQNRSNWIIQRQALANLKILESKMPQTDFEKIVLAADSRAVRLSKFSESQILEQAIGGSND
jgi:hypothetical protein